MNFYKPTECNPDLPNSPDAIEYHLTRVDTESTEDGIQPSPEDLLILLEEFLVAQRERLENMS